MGAMTEEPQLGSIQERIAALKRSQSSQSQTGGAPQSPPFLPRPPTERSSSANNVNASALSGALSQSATRPTHTPSAQLEVRAKKTPPPVPTRRADRPPPPLPTRPELPTRPDLPARPEPSGRQRQQPPSSPEVRPTLPPRRPTDSSRKRSQESLVSNTSYSTAGASLRHAASTTSLSSNDTGRIKAPAWGQTELPVLPPKRPQVALDELKPLPRSESSSNSMVSGLTSKISALRGRVSGSPSPSPSSSARVSGPSHPSARDSSPRPQVPPRRPSTAQTQSNGTNGDDEEYRPSLPIRRLPPPSSADSIKDARQAGFGSFNKSPGSPPMPGSRPSVNGASSGAPPPVPHGSRPSAHSPPQTSGRGKVSNIDNPRTFKELISSGPVLVDFFATYCGPCKQVAPKISALAEKYQNVLFLQVDIEVMKTVAREYQVQAMPTFVLMLDGEEDKRVVGGNVFELEQWLKTTPGAPAAPTHGLVCNADNPKVFATLTSSGSVLVDFYATYCGPCKEVAPKIGALSEKYQNVRFLQVDIDAAKATAAEYQITAMPTFILMRDGREDKRVIGANVWELEQWLQSQPA